MAIRESEVPAETSLTQQKFPLAEPGRPYTSTWVNIDSSVNANPRPEERPYKAKEPAEGLMVDYPNREIWPRPKAGPFKAKLADGSVVTYYWYRCIDQPTFWQYTRPGDRSAWSAEKKDKLQALVEKIHANWPND